MRNSSLPMDVGRRFLNVFGVLKRDGRMIDGAFVYVEVMENFPVLGVFRETYYRCGQGGDWDWRKDGQVLIDGESCG